MNITWRNALITILTLFDRLDATPVGGILYVLPSEAIQMMGALPCDIAFELLSKGQTVLFGRTIIVQNPDPAPEMTWAYHYFEGRERIPCRICGKGEQDAVHLRLDARSI